MRAANGEYVPEMFTEDGNGWHSSELWKGILKTMKIMWRLRGLVLAYLSFNLPLTA